MLNNILYAVVKLLSRTPFWLIYPISDFVSWVLCYVIRYRRDVVRANIKACFAEKSIIQRHKIAREFYRGFVDTVLEAVKTLTITQEEVLKRFRYNDSRIMKELMDRDNNNHIMMFGHCANWEWLMYTKLIFPDFNMMALFQKIENPFINIKLRQCRERFGMTTVEAKDSLRYLAKLPNDGNTLVAFVADQSPAKHLIKHWVKFFGIDTPVHIGTHQIAKKLKYGVFFLEMKREARGYYVVTPVPIYYPGDVVSEYQIIDRFFVLLEQQIRNSPECWLWSHRRWKYADQHTQEDK